MKKVIKRSYPNAQERYLRKLERMEKEHQDFKKRMSHKEAKK